MNIEEIERIVELVNASDISELTLRVGDIELVARKGELSEQPSNRTDLKTKHLPVAEPENGTDLVVPTSISTPSENIRPQGSNAEIASVDDERSQEIVIKAPMLGIFYRAPSPGAPPFAEVGQIVKEGDTVGTIEVMKLFSSLASPTTGRVKEFLVGNSQLVEHGQPLVILEAVGD
jgi:acetyl-CoA carboxylase biotin carboxyl carrier protein